MLIGADFSRRGLTPGRLYFAVNDNPHWQNNIGAFRVSLQATEAYDVGGAQLLTRGSVKLRKVEGPP